MVVESEISKLIDLDFECQARLKAAHDKKLNINQELSIEKEKIETSTWNTAKEVVSKERAKLLAEIAAINQKAEADSQQAAKALQDAFNAKETEWIAEIFKRTTGIN